MPRTKKQKATLARVLTIASAVALFLIFIVRDIVRENLKDLHDSLARAEAQFRSYAGQSEIARRSQEQNIKTILDQLHGVGAATHVVTPDPSALGISASQQSGL
jgi:hypothetical protein